MKLSSCMRTTRINHFCCYIIEGVYCLGYLEVIHSKFVPEALVKHCHIDTTQVASCKWMTHNHFMLEPLPHFDLFRKPKAPHCDIH